MTPAPTLILVAHGSTDPRSPEVARALVGRIRRLRPSLDVRVAFLEKSGPDVREVLADVARHGGRAVAVPMLLASAYHARVDLPGAIAESGADVRQAAALGEDPTLIALLGQRLAEAGYSPAQRHVGVIVTAVGSSDDAANGRTATVATALARGARWAGVGVAFGTGPRPTLAEAAEDLRARGATHLVAAPWFLAPGVITDRIARAAATLDVAVAQPLGSHNLVAAALLDRYDEAVTARVAA